MHRDYVHVQITYTFDLPISDSFSHNVIFQSVFCQATLDHEMKFSKGFIIRSKKILAPIQKDVFIKYGFMTMEDEDAPVANTKTHDKALQEFQKTVRYMANTNKVIADKADSCQQLAFGEVMMADS